MVSPAKHQAILGVPSNFDVLCLQNEFISVVSSRPTLGKIETTLQNRLRSWKSSRKGNINPLNANIIAVNYSRIANIVFIKDKR